MPPTAVITEMIEKTPTAIPSRVSTERSLDMRIALNAMMFNLARVVGPAVGGLVLALILSGIVRGGGLFRSLMIVPWAVPAVVSGIIKEGFRRLGTI